MGLPQAGAHGHWQHKHSARSSPLLRALGAILLSRSSKRIKLGPPPKIGSTLLRL